MVFLERKLLKFSSVQYAKNENVFSTKNVALARIIIDKNNCLRS